MSKKKKKKGKKVLFRTEGTGRVEDIIVTSSKLEEVEGYARNQIRNTLRERK